ncbi:MAG: carbonic anhydrase [Nitrospiraceae bacterium]|nr:carbonic anhydrase [Nitrospiraceae bacterium]
MKKLRVFFAAAIFVLAFSVFVHGEIGTDDALQKLMAGNGRYVSGQLASRDLSDAKRKGLVADQHPSATVLTCSDSRVSPTLLFDQGLGDVFVVRTAGNVVDKIALGSLEYGVEHLHTPVLVILGHQSCGAVTAAFDAKGKPEGNIGAILKKIGPSVRKVKSANHKDRGEMINLAVQQNVRAVYADIMKNSPAIRELVKEGKLKVVLAEYYLDSGKVEEIASK